MQIQAELSLYPLSAGDPLPAILAFVDHLERAGLRVEPGPMSSTVGGESGIIFPAIQLAYEAAACEGRYALVIKVINRVA